MNDATHDDARFELRGRLGEGGMGTVHRAFDRLYGREVALKVGRGAVGAERDAARIGEEFALLATLDHGGLVRVLDFGMSGASTWLTSEIVEGPRLDVWAGRLGRDGGEDALAATTAELIDTLAWLFARGLVHGDVKPANVLVGATGPVLIDFGLAGSGDVLFGATRAYAAPELLAGEAPSPASDLFALGRTLERLPGRRTGALARLVTRLTEARAQERATVDEARAILGVDHTLAARGVTPIASWSGAIERALRVLERAPIEVRIARALASGFARALAARLTLDRVGVGSPAWLLPDGAGLEPFARVAAALGQEMRVPVSLASDQKEVLDAFTDELIAYLRDVPSERRPTLIVQDAGALGEAGRFVLARLVEAAALPGFVVIGEARLGRGVAGAFERLEVLASEAEGRDWEAEWEALSAGARAAARELWGLGGAARLDELTGALGGAVEARRALIELAAAGLTERAAARRTGLREEVREALEGVLGVSAQAPAADERRRWVEVLTRARAAGGAGEAMLAALAGHAEALGDGATAKGARREAAAAAEGAFAWARAAEQHVAAARLMVASEPEAACEAAFSALDALFSVGGGPLVDVALGLAQAAAAAVPGARGAELMARVRIAAARAAVLRGRKDEAVRAASAVLAEHGGGRLPWKVELDALLVRGTALSHGDERAAAERDLSAAAALAETHADLHALGRTTNNLGLLAFHRGDLAAAAEAWARTAEAKARTGDRRGERIGRHNRGLALRELGRLEEAEVAAEEAAALAERIGDQVGRATAALARAQLALDRGDVARAEAALAAFSEIGWKPAMVEADGRIVRVRLDLAKGASEAAERGAGAALEEAEAAGLEPVAAEAWALSQVISRRPSEPPEFVRGALARAADEHGGLAMLLLCARVFGEAHAGRWGEARAGLEVIARRVATGVVPPAARIGLGLAAEAARLVDPALAERIVGEKGDRGARENGRQGDATGDDGAVLMTPPDVELVDLAGWARRIRKASGASRVELVPLEGEAVVAAGDGAAGARFVELGRRVARRGERFVARGADGRAQALALPLVVGESAVGALVAAFEGGRAEAGRLEGEAGRVLGVVALALAHAQERRRRERAEAEVGRLEAELAQRLEQHEAEVTALRDALEQSQSALALRHDYGDIVHRSGAMRRILQTLDKVTDRELPVLILGESGVGKELLARALHFNSPRKKARFVAENCGAIPKDLFESQFFGHVKGAFTGALAPRQGLFESAQGGTLFLDEVGELPLEMQVKLLRVLQDKIVRPVGSNREVPVDFRLVCATNRDLAQMVAEGRFREDLFYRIAVVKIDVPPLRKRPEDIVPIAERLLAMHAGRLGRAARLTPEAADRLAAYPFPGNVRELDNEILRALALSDGQEIRPRHLSATIHGGGGRSEPRRRASGDGGDHGLESLESAFARVERELLIKHLRASNGRKVAAAKSLGLSRPGLDAKLLRHGIDVKELARSLKERPR